MWLKNALLPWMLVLSAVTGGAGVWWGMGLGQAKCEARQLKQDAVVAAAVEASQQAAAAEIAKIKIVNRTNETRLEREIVRVPDFSNCRAGPDAERVLNDALAGKTSAESVGGGVLPGTEPAD